MKKRDLLRLNQALTSIESLKFTVKFSYFVAKNKVLIKDEYSILDEARKPDPKFMEFDTKRAQLAHDLAERDEKGQPKIENNNFVIIENFDKFKEKLDKLKEEYADAIKNQEKRSKDFESLLDEDFEFKGTKIDLKNIPSQIEPSVLEIFIIADLIEE